MSNDNVINFEFAVELIKRLGNKHDRRASLTCVGTCELQTLYRKGYSPHRNRLARKAFGLAVGQFRSADGLALLAAGSEASDYLPPQIYLATNFRALCSRN